MAEHRTIATDEDAVCGMTVDLAIAKAKGLVTTRDSREYGFCGKGCLLEFGDEPETFLAVGYKPSM